MNLNSASIMNKRDWHCYKSDSDLNYCSNHFSYYSLLPMFLPENVLKQRISKGLLLVRDYDVISMHSFKLNNTITDSYSQMMEISSDSKSDTVQSKKFDGMGKEMFSLTNNNLFELVMNNVELDKIAKLKKGWDMYGAEPIPRDVIQLTRNIIQKLIVQPEIFPTGRRTIQIQKKKKSGDYIEFEIFNACQIKGLYVDSEGNYEEMILSSDEEVVKYYNEY